MSRLVVFILFLFAAPLVIAQSEQDEFELSETAAPKDYNEETDAPEDYNEDSAEGVIYEPGAEKD